METARMLVGMLLGGVALAVSIALTPERSTVYNPRLGGVMDADEHYCAQIKCPAPL